MPELSILISSAGRRVELMRCFREDATRLGLDLRIIATDVNPALSAACHEADVAARVPPCHAPDYLTSMMRLCQEHRVKLVVPTIDPELPIWAAAREQFAAEGVRVVVSAPSVIALAADKHATALKLTAHGIPAPRTLPLKEYRQDHAALAWPVVIKPVSGSSSQGVRFPRTVEEVSAAPDTEGMIAQERWMGREYTVNVFYDTQSRLRCALSHERIEIRAGEVSKAVTRRLPVLENIAEALGGAFPGLMGVVCFQAIVKDSGECAVFEVNARFGGGYPLAHRAGARFTQWLLEEVSGLPLSASNVWKESVTMLRYDSAVFLNG